MIEIEKNIKVPRSKKAKADDERRMKILNDYVYWYTCVHVRKPELLETYILKGTQYFRLDTLQTAVSEKRLKELTTMLRSRTRGNL